MASTFRLKRKTYSEWGIQAREAFRKGKAAGLTGKELQNYVSLNSGSSFAGAGLGNRLGGPTVIQANNSGVTTGGNMVSLTGQSNTKYGKTYKGGADKAFKNVTTQQTNIAKQEAQRAAQRAANKKSSASGIAEAAKKARTQGYNAGYNKAANNVGIMQGMKNTWGRMGTMGKVGTVAGAAAVGGLALKGLFGNKKD